MRRWRSELERRAALLQAVADHEGFSASRLFGIANLDKRQMNAWLDHYEKKEYIIVQRFGKPIHGTPRRYVYITQTGKQVLLEYYIIRGKLLEE